MGFGSISMNMINVQPESTVEIGLWSESSISTNGKSSITSFIVPTSAKSDLMYTNTSKLGYNASINTSPKSTINSNTDISSRIFTSDRTKRNEIKKNNRTSTRNNPSSDQLSTGTFLLSLCVCQLYDQLQYGSAITLNYYLKLHHYLLF